MRSVKYMLFKTPSCFADCVDYMMENKLLSVNLKLSRQQAVHEIMGVVERFLGVFTWTFENKTVQYEEVMGGIFATESVKRQELSVFNANRRLERRIRDFEQFAISLSETKERFRLEREGS